MLHARLRSAPWASTAILLLLVAQVGAHWRLGDALDITAAVTAFGPAIAAIAAGAVLVDPAGSAGRAAARPVQRISLVFAAALLIIYVGATVATGSAAMAPLVRNVVGSAAVLLLASAWLGASSAWMPLTLYVSAAALVAHPASIDAWWAWPVASPDNVGAALAVAVLLTLAILVAGRRRFTRRDADSAMMRRVRPGRRRQRSLR